MKNKIYLLKIFALLFILTSCSNTTRLQYSIQGGINKGGITENTDLTVLPGVPVAVDAYTGATQTGFNTGVHAIKQLKGTQLETGIDYMLNSQSFTYNDAVNNFTGIRKLSVSQFMVPFSWNIILFRNLLPQQEPKVKIGAVGQYNIVAVNDKGTLPGHSINPFSAGASLGFGVYPLILENGNKVGLFVEGYRGSRVYEDFYNRSEDDMPGSSYVKFGVSFKF